MTEVHLKLALENYIKLKRDVKKCKERLEMLDCKKYNMPGSVIKMPEGSTKSRETKLHEIFTSEKPLEQMVKQSQYYIDLVDWFISTLPKEEKPIFEDRFIKGKTIESIAEKHYMSRWTVSRLFDKRIKEFIEQT